MRRILDEVILSVIGQVNRLVFGLSRGRIVLYRFRGVPTLTVTTPADPLGEMVSVACLPDDDSYLVLVHPLHEAGLRALLDSSRAVEAARGPDQAAIPADLDRLTDPAERSALLKQALSQASMQERAQVRRLGLTPIARLRPHEPFPETGHSAFAVAMVTEDDSGSSSGAR
jgi:hypothetical protein